MQLDRNRPELRPLKGGAPLESWIEDFANNDPARAERYRYALSLFLGYPEPSASEPGWASHAYVKRSPRTLRAYRFAVIEFFEFLAKQRGRIVPPHEVTRRDAFDYAEWLSHKGSGRWDFSLRGERLNDGEHPDELAVYEAVRQLGSATVMQIARRLPPSVLRRHPPLPKQLAVRNVDEQWLTGTLKELVRRDMMTRSPTLAEIRREHPRAGFDDVVDPEIFTYAPATVEPVSRSTIALRLSALSAFWRVLQKGENTGPKALLDYNVFEDALESVNKGLAAAKRQSSLSKRPSAELVGRVVAVADGPRLVDQRNVALLWLLLLMGTRIEETLQLRRGEPGTEAERLKYPGWLDRSTDPVTVVLQRKGGVPQVLALPPFVLGALNVFWDHLSRLVPDDVDPSDRRYRYKLLLREPDAPLFPPVGLWGANSPGEEGEWGLWAYRKPLTRQAVQMTLRRLSERAGLSDAERRRIHPHGFRHLAAEAMAAEGDLRRAQAILGHRSILTTEKYLPDEHDPIYHSAQSEVLDYLAKHGFWPDGPPAIKTPDRRPEPPTRVIRTYGREESPDRPQEGGRLPSAPPAPRALPEPLERATEGLVAVGQALSPPCPRAPYEALADGKKPADLVWSAVPQSRWISENYPDIPVGYGIGSETLLVWWQKDAPEPWPVLAPAQAHPELTAESGFLSGLERLYDRWITERPTATLALAQWLYFLGMLTVGLENSLRGDYSWASYDAYASIGHDFRAHSDDWLVRWFEKNADTFTVAQRRFAKAPKPTAGETADEYWERVRQNIGVAGFLPSVPRLPEWYFETDPVRAIYERSGDEWKAFVRWLERLTGKKPSDVRTEHREEQAAYLEQSEESRERQAREFINAFYSIVDELGAQERSRTEAERQSLEQQREIIRSHLKKEFGIKMPKRAAESSTRRAERTTRLVRQAFQKAEAPIAELNALGESRMFSPEAFRIDPSRHTIRHTAQYRERFAQEHHGKDSECVMRRIARAMWEKVKTWEYSGTRRKPTEAEQRRELFVVLLAQLAYVVPCPADVEKELVRSGLRYTRPGDVAGYMNERIAKMAEGAEPEGPIDELASDIAAVYFEQTERPEAFTEREARALVANARRATPHPLRLVAATFWPV